MMMWFLAGPKLSSFEMVPTTMEVWTQSAMFTVFGSLTFILVNDKSNNGS